MIKNPINQIRLFGDVQLCVAHPGNVHYLTKLVFGELSRTAAETEREETHFEPLHASKLNAGTALNEVPSAAV